VISGFLITYLLLAEKEKLQRIGIGSFLIRRALRIWPLYFLVVASVPITHILFSWPYPGQYWQYFLFLGNFELIEYGLRTAALNHVWSICVEEHFYFIIPFIIALVKKERLPSVFMLIIFISFMYRASISGTQNYWLNAYLNTIARMDVIAIGCLLGYLYHENKIRLNHNLFIQAIAWAIFMYLMLNEDSKYWDNLFLITMKKYIYIFFPVYFMGNFLFNKNNQWLNPKENGIFNRLGKMSYGIYMFNPFVIGITLFYFQQYKYNNFWMFLLIVHVALFGICLLSYYYFEKPFLNLKNKFRKIRES
jgi:peptidoglycan/LPS O-acetylase OafA/YrhL